MPLNFHQQLFTAFLAATALFAAVRGGAPERITACSFVVALVLTNIVASPLIGAYQHPEWGIMFVDATLLTVVTANALLSTRYWALPMASMQLVDVLGHLAKLLDPLLLPRAYYILVAWISWPMVGLLIGGVMWHRRRLAKFGIDFAWSCELPKLYLTGWHAYERCPSADQE